MYIQKFGATFYGCKISGRVPDASPADVLANLDHAACRVIQSLTSCDGLIVALVQESHSFVVSVVFQFRGDALDAFALIPEFMGAAFVTDYDLTLDEG